MKSQIPRDHHKTKTNKNKKKKQCMCILCSKLRVMILTQLSKLSQSLSYFAALESLYQWFYCTVYTKIEEEFQLNQGQIEMAYNQKSSMLRTKQIKIQGEKLPLSSTKNAGYSMKPIIQSSELLKALKSSATCQIQPQMQKRQKRQHRDWEFQKTT